MTALDATTADRLAKLLGMLGSDHDGERASAAAMADKLVRSHGLTWQQVIFKSGAPDLITVPEKIAFALADIGALSMWERGFIYDVSGRCSLKPKQLVVLDQIAKARAYAEARS